MKKPYSRLSKSELQNDRDNSLQSRFQHPLKQWLKAAAWCLLYILFIAWVGNFWWILLLPLVFDAFITQYIPWTWWKKSQNKTVLAVMGWIDAIVFALVAVYFINHYLFQNYQIPTSSLEKTLLVGDFLFVSKASYGPRVPNTPFSFPLVQHTFPIINTKSYLENPQWEYKRLKGFDTIERNDIVVFNFPTGDTVPVKVWNPDYYVSSYYEGYKSLITQDSSTEPTAEACMARGREIIRLRKDVYGELVYRPVDRRENYVKRCVAIPGDFFEIRDNVIYINNEPEEELPGVQHNYFIQTNGRFFSSDMLTKLGISKEDRRLLSGESERQLISYLGMDPTLPVYHFPLNGETLDKMKSSLIVKSISVEPSIIGDEVFPYGGGHGWNRDNYGPIYIPRKGGRLKLNEWNISIYERIIRVYEKNTLVVKDGKFYINGEETGHYTFKMDYYWMMGDNRHKSADSRYWGFVPEDHVVGRPVAVWLSLDKDKSWFEGKIRFNRFFKDARR